jgi:hypothetical protein
MVFSVNMLFGFLEIAGFPPVICLAFFLGIIGGIVLVAVGVCYGKSSVSNSHYNTLLQSASVPLLASPNSKKMIPKPIILAIIGGAITLFFGLIVLVAILGTKPSTISQKFTEAQLEVFRNGSLKEVKMLVRQGVNVKTQTEDGVIPFYVGVCSNPNIDVVKYLISQGVDVNNVFPFAAGGNSNANVVEYLISRGADVNAKDEWGWTPLHRAVEQNSNIDVLKCLVMQGANVNAKIERNRGKTPLHLAAEKNPDINVLKYLISQGAYVNAKTEFGQTPLDLANSEEKKKFLRDAGGE